MKNMKVKSVSNGWIDRGNPVISSQIVTYTVGERKVDNIFQTLEPDKFTVSFEDGTVLTLFEVKSVLWYFEGDIEDLKKQNTEIISKPPSDFTGWVKTNPATNDLVAFCKNGKLVFGFGGVDQWVQTPHGVKLNGTEIIASTNDFMSPLREYAIQKTLISKTDNLNWNGTALFQTKEHLEPFEILDAEGNWFPF